MTSLALAVMVPLSVLSASPENAPPRKLIDAYQRSVKTGQPLVVMLGADWCPACLEMRDETLPQVDKAGGMEGVEFAYLDVDRHRKLAGKFSCADAVPQLVRFDRTRKGWKSRCLVGAKSVKEVTSFLTPDTTPKVSMARPSADRR